MVVGCLLLFCGVFGLCGFVGVCSFNCGFLVIGYLIVWFWVGFVGGGLLANLWVWGLFLGSWVLRVYCSWLF